MILAADTEGMHQESGLHDMQLRVVAARDGCPAVVDDGGTVHLVESFHADQSVMADPLGVEKTPVGLEAEFLEVIRVAMPAPVSSASFELRTNVNLDERPVLCGL